MNRDLAPDEPHWAEDGTYMAYLKVRQDLDRFNALPVADQEQIIGRRKTDGSRLDLQAGTDPRTEGEFVAPTPSPNSHVRKTGPRGALHDRTLIFRRGVPYLNIREDGGLDGGLQFVSFQSSLDAFEVMLNKWEFNPNFPAAGSGMDRLFIEGYATIEKAGFFFVPPRDNRFIGASIFDPPPTAGRSRGPGRIVIRKRVIDASGNRVLAEVGGIGFQVFQADTNQPIGGVFMTDSAGHAVSDDVPLNTPLVLREVSTPAHLEPMPEHTFTVTQRRQLVKLDNRVRPGPAPGYGG
ncbi:Dyp-type peroxidase [Rubrobacter marinus]|uniref:Dyp-type peroxidase n=1 Tax=Rubrobacter marinus TaxID=2653852 RepID=UPI00140BF55C|nr:Dyp-type peroxidase [Rubrobacter marinus]